MTAQGGEQPSQLLHAMHSKSLTADKLLSLYSLTTQAMMLETPQATNFKTDYRPSRL